MRSAWGAGLVAIWGLGLWACGGTDAGDVKVPFGKFQDSSLFDFQGTVFGTQGTAKLGKIGTIDIGGKTWGRNKVGYNATSAADLLAPDAYGPEVYGHEVSDRHWIVAGVKVPSGAEFIPATPLDIQWNFEVGVPQTIEVQGNYTVPTEPNPIPFDTTVQGQLKETGVTLQTEAGLFTNLEHYEGSFIINGFGSIHLDEGVSIQGELWAHKDLGLIAFKAPTLNIGFDFTGSSDYGDATSGYNTIRKVGFTSAANPTFELSTYDRIQQNDADKDVHAKMLMELRWAEEDQAKTGDMPSGDMFNFEFGTVWGTFPASLIESPVSIFHPEENGQGFRYWYAFVDQAAKNEPANGILYRISVNCDPAMSPLRVSARIHYKLYQE